MENFSSAAEAVAAKRAMSPIRVWVMQFMATFVFLFTAFMV